MPDISTLDNLPEISLLEDEGITLKSLQQEMIEDYEKEYERATEEELTLYPTDERRISLTVTAGKLFQMYEIINERFRLNFLQYMYGDYLRNWGSNFGFNESGAAYSHVTLQFHASLAQGNAIGIPEGTRATAGDNVFFATGEYAEIPAGEGSVEVTAYCTQAGALGNDYTPGQINIIADPVNLVSSVNNIDTSAGGRDEYADDELKELIYNFPSTYSTAGPEDCYIQFTKAYSSDIADVRIDTNDDAVVKIYIIRENGIIPDEEYCEGVRTYLKGLKNMPDTDKIEVLPPEKIPYELDATYYISEERRDIASSIQESVSEAVQEFISHTHSKIGCDINPDLLVAYAGAAGARRIKVPSPQYRKISNSQIAVCERVALTYGGLESE